jgi:hypothetical protein
MKIKKGTIVLLFMAYVSFGMTEKLMETKTEIKSTTVYVCGKSKIYHKSKYHSALGRCKSGIKKMTESKAKNLKKRVCKCRS